ncbi:MAG TPA: S8 family peptidase [Vicinamibacteria bacterium]|nr:S8 family peptidase [Vicinamibacteria bacterium]
MRLSSRVATAAAVLGLALPMFRPVKAREGWRVASLRPLEDDTPRARARASQVIVQFRADTPEREVARLARMAGGERARRSSFGHRYLVDLDAGFTPQDAVARLSGLPEVQYAEHNGRLHAFFRPNDTGFSAQWNFRMLDAERTWDIQQGDPSVVVAVLDTGIAYEDFGPYRKAPDFGTTTFVPGFDFVNNDAHANDDNFHGTHVASVIGESTDNVEGVAGFAFRAALMPVKVLDQNGDGSFFDVAEGIDFAVRNPNVKVINLSLGGESSSTTVRLAIDRAVAARITVVAASGNDTGGPVSFPAALPNVIAVGAVDGRKQRARYSNFGPELDLVAPGGDNRRDDTGPDLVPDGRPDGILQQTLDPDSAARGIYDDFGYFFVTGTSQATPHVAALAALLYHQGITDPIAIKAVMEQTAQDLGASGRDNEYGHGLIRPSIALKGLGLNLPF